MLIMQKATDASRRRRRTDASHPGLRWKCSNCGKEFETQRGMRAHYAQAHGESLVEQKSCETCGKVFRDYKGNRRFCSKKCAGVYFSKQYNQGKTAICETCLKEFHISPSHPRRFCSRECYRTWLKTIPVDIPKFWELLRSSPYGTGTLAEAAKVHPDEVQRLIAKGKGKFPLVNKLEGLIGSFAVISSP